MELTIPSQSDAELLKKINSASTLFWIPQDASGHKPEYVSIVDSAVPEDIHKFLSYDKSSKVFRKRGVYQSKIEKWEISLKTSELSVTDFGRKRPYSIRQDGIKVYQHGKSFRLIDSPQSKPQDFLNLIKGLEETDERTPVAVNSSGELVYCRVFFDKTNNRKLIFFTFNDGNLKTFNSISDFSSLNGRMSLFDISICEEKPMMWLVSNGVAITENAPIISFPQYDFEHSVLKTAINSNEFQEAMGLSADLSLTNVVSVTKAIETPIVEPTKTKTNPFKRKEATLDEQIKNALSMGIIPYVVGAPGVGKTAVITSQSSHVIRHNMATFSPTSFTGKDYLVPGKVRTREENGEKVTITEDALTGVAEPVWLQEVKKALEESKQDGEDVILFLDEFDKLTPNLQVFINGVVDEEPTLGGWRIPEGVKIILAGNTKVDSLASNNISSEVASRLMKIEAKVNPDEWIKWAVKHGVDPIVIAYIKTYPEDLITTEYDENNRVDAHKSLNPRTWVRNISQDVKRVRMDGTGLLVDNYMSQKQAKKFLTFIDRYFLTNIEGILSGEDEFSLKEDLGANTFALGILAALIDISNIKNIFVNITNPELRMFFLHEWCKYHEEDKKQAYILIKESEIESGRKNGTNQPGV